MDQTKMKISGIGPRIVKARKTANHTQMALAMLTGIDPTVISRYERDVQTVGIENLAKICVALGLSLDFAVFGSEHKKRRSRGK